VVTDPFSPGELIGRAVVLPAEPDSFGNVPVGKDPDDYHPRSQAARDLTHKTGNAGNRIARGVITSSARQLRPEEPPRTTGADHAVVVVTTA
jgi:Cu/Zn superoxide dismutase